MNLEHIFKQLRRIEPDREYVRRSRRFILSRASRTEVPMTLSSFVMNSIQISSSIIIAGLLIVLLLGGFSQNTLLTPFRLSGLNLEGLRAEADAIDIQIKLVSPRYEEIVQSLVNETTTAAVVAPLILSSPEQPVQSPKQEAVEPASDASPSITIEEALERLAE